MLTQEEYNAKREARYNRLLAAAEKAAQESEGNLSRARQMADVIPFGQPILIGHHSEKGDRNYRSRIESKYRRGFELMKRAAELRSRAESAASNDAIMSDDPSAPDQLADKIAKLEALQEQYKAVNAAYKKFLKDPASLDAAPISPTYKLIIREFEPEWSRDKPIRTYNLTNNSANIRRLKERAEQVAKKQAQEDKQEEINGIKIEYCPSENRIRLFYPGRVDLDTFNLLRQHGFRVLRTMGEGAFSAYYNRNALYFVQKYIKESK